MALISLHANVGTCIEAPLFLSFCVVVVRNVLNTLCSLHSLIQPQASLELIDVGSALSGVALHHLYALPHHMNVGVVPPLSIPTAIEGLHSTFNYGDEWFPLDKQLLWEHLRHKTVSQSLLQKATLKSACT